MLLYSFTSWLAFGSIVLALPRADPPTPVLVNRQASSASPVPDGECTNGPRTRACWSNGYSIATDFDAKSPPDGTTVTYNLEISNTTRPNPDGSGGIRPLMLINGQYPGPLIRAKWGDTIVVNVKNNLQHNGTGIHWHGLRQLNSCQHDGVPGVTECPIAPGKSRQYRFRATQFGTSWYHSHWSAQYGDGVLGTIIIDGPATENYDEDLGTLPLTDWYYPTAFTLNEVAQHSGPPQADNILVNGTHVNADGGGNYAKMNVVKGKKYRIRIINTSVDAFFSVSMDGHPFTVITADFVPVKKWVTNQLTLAIGQRYDVVISANQTVDNYWFRVSPGTLCARNRIVGKGVQIGAVLHYEGASDANPTSTTDVTMRTTCADESTQSLVPFVPNQVPTNIVGNAGRMNLSHFSDPTRNNLFRWLIDGSPHIVDWNNPTLETILAGSQNFGPTANVKSMQTKDAWYLWWIQSTATIKLAHPIHLHGHDFYIVGEGTGVWDGTTNNLNFNNPTRRDTATLPPDGYLLIAFPADNPGMWIMHCHIAWHASQGLSMQFGERYSDLQGGSLGDTGVLKSGCDDWDKYWFQGNPEKPYEQTDSGI
ncbi:laccase-1 precursor [Phaeosphaeriaceae sp. PMI808]|nr:laccase-1 precursor [Phaeosphaeriaceae sp. PMI808]